MNGAASLLQRAGKNPRGTTSRSMETSDAGELLALTPISMCNALSAPLIDPKINALGSLPFTQLFRNLTI